MNKKQLMVVWVRGGKYVEGKKGIRAKQEKTR